MAHIHEKIDFTASVYIVRDGKVLLHLHKKYNRWMQPGGHIELDEDPNQAAIREAKEETGFDIKLIGSPQSTITISDGSDIIPPRFLNRHHATETHEHIDFTYFARIVGGTEQSEEESELRWFTKEEIEKNDINLYESNRAYCLQALEELA